MEIKYLVRKGLQKILSGPIIRQSVINKNAAVWNDCMVINSSIDEYSYVSDHTSMYYVRIGKFCSVGPYCAIGGASHPIDFVSTSPVFLEGRNALKKNFANLPYEPYKETVIGNDVWIGGHCCIRSGVKIGDGAVIGMGSVLLHDVGTYEIWAGNPARMIRKRFDDEMIEKLESICWWDGNKTELYEVGESESNPSQFIYKTLETRKRDGKV